MLNGFINYLPDVSQLQQPMNLMYFSLCVIILVIKDISIVELCDWSEGKWDLHFPLQKFSEIYKVHCFS